MYEVVKGGMTSSREMLLTVVRAVPNVTTTTNVFLSNGWVQFLVEVTASSRHLVLMRFLRNQNSHILTCM